MRRRLAAIRRRWGGRGSRSGICDFAGWVEPGTLWLDGWLVREAGGSNLAVQVRLDGASHRGPALELRYPRGDLAVFPGAEGVILICEVGGRNPARRPRRVEDVGIEVDGSKWRWYGAQGLQIADDLAPRLTGLLRDLEPGVRDRMLAFLETARERAGSPADRTDPAAPPGRVPKSASLARPSDPTGSQPTRLLERFGAAVEHAFQPDEDSIFLRGWIWDPRRAVDRLRVVTPSGRWEVPLAETCRLHRPDVDERYMAPPRRGRHGFLAFVPASAPEGSSVEFVGDGRTVGSARLPAPVVDPFAARELLMKWLPEDEPPSTRFFERHLYPAISRLTDRRRRLELLDRRLEFGSSPGSPEVTLIVPLSDQLDCLEPQLAGWADDPARDQQEILYVLAAPELGHELERRLFDLARFYRIGIRAVIARHHLDHSLATSLGATCAAGRVLGLLHFDTFPATGRSLERLAEIYSSIRQAGVLGPKLLYEDGSIQQAGVVFATDLHSDGHWAPLSRFKGMPKQYPPANEAAVAPAVGGGCYLISRELFEELGGLSNGYLSAAFDDLDLCQRCWQSDRTVWYTPEVELYHLEIGRDEETVIRRGHLTQSLYDRWLLSRRWGAQLEHFGSDPRSRRQPRRFAHGVATPWPDEAARGSAEAESGRTSALRGARDELLGRSSMDLTDAERRLLADLEVGVHAEDSMFEDGRAMHYLTVGLSALRAVDTILAHRDDPTPIESILDLGSGFGRVLRFLAARFPAARLTAVEILPEALAFCSRTFGARTAVSTTDLDTLTLPGQHDLIWCGSVVTHLDAPQISKLLGALGSALRPGGLGIFSTHGDRCLELIRDGKTYGLDQEGLDGLVEKYRTKGFGYVDYPGQSGYGISLSDPQAMKRLASAAADWRQVAFLAGAWDDHHDVYGFVRL